MLTTRPENLTAAEWFVLHQGMDADGRETFELALAEAVHVGLVRAAGDRLEAADAAPAGTPRPLAAVREAVASLPRPAGGGCLARAVRQRLAWPGNLFVVDDVLLGLVERGWFRTEQYRLFLLIPARCFPMTPAGEAVRRAVEKRVVTDRWREPRPWSAVGRTALALAGVPPRAVPPAITDAFRAALAGRAPANAG